MIKIVVKTDAINPQIMSILIHDHPTAKLSIPDIAPESLYRFIGHNSSIVRIYETPGKTGERASCQYD